MSIVIGLHAAAARAGLPRTSLRRLVAKCQLSATKARDGTWSFDADDLDRLRAERAGSISAGAAAAPSPVSGAVAPATGVVIASAPPAAMGSLAPWMAAAVEACDSESDRDQHDGDPVDGDDDEEQTYQPPFWASGTDAGPSYPTGTPVIDPSTYRVFYRPEPVTAIHAPGTAGAVVQQLQAQAAELRAQLASATAACEQWRTAWRGARTAAIAGAIMNEAAGAGANPASVDAAWRAAGAAVERLPDDQLASELYALGVGRAAGNAAAMRVAGAVGFGGPDPHSGDHDLARARIRRRSQTPRS
ncbi:MAG: hypothetical protein JWP01_3965 [Myxococcales bacterium]|nr:hypothetical protein [Myxococcales bacterium]